MPLSRQYVAIFARDLVFNLVSLVVLSIIVPMRWFTFAIDVFEDGPQTVYTCTPIPLGIQNKEQYHRHSKSHRYLEK